MSDEHTEETIIAIQCPSCKTKFGIDAGVLGQVTRPRFHCSKCDTTFSKSLASIMTALSRVSSESSGVTAARTELRDSAVGPSSHRNVEQSPIGQPSAPPSTSLTREVAPKQVGQTVAATQVSSVGASASLRSSSSRSPSSSESNAGVGDETSFSSARAGTVGSVRDGRGDSETMISRVFIALTPLVGIKLLLLGVTVWVVSNPRSVGRLHPRLLSTAQRVAPPEIQILKPQFRKQDLDNGDSVYVISGRVANRSGRGFSQIQVQGLTFDENSRPLQKGTGVAGSALTTAHLSTLSRQSIVEQQHGSLRREGKETRVDAQGGAEFAVVVAPSDETPAFFSARVFAVGSER